MALFGNKEPVQCSICGNETGTGQSKKHKVVDGVVCDECFKKAGLYPGIQYPYDIQLINEQITSSDGLSILERYEGKSSSESEPIKCPRCNSTQISTDKKGFGVGKAVVGAALVGGIGLAAGNIGAKKVRITCLKCGHQWWAGQQ